MKSGDSKMLIHGALISHDTVGISHENTGPKNTWTGIWRMRDSVHDFGPSLCTFHVFPFPQEEETSRCFTSIYYCTSPPLWCFLHTAHSKSE